MEVPLILQFSIALFTGMVASTFIPPVRRSIPRYVEVGMWIGLVTVCVLGVLSVTDKNARELTSSAAWGADQIVNTTVGLLGAGVVAWISEHRFAIATTVVILAGLDILVLALLRSLHRSARYQPRVRLRDWMELPLASHQPVAARTSAFEGLNRRVTAVLAFGVATGVRSLLGLAVWARDVVMPSGARQVARAASAGRVQSKARLESMRDAAAQLQFAARAWYAAAGAPAVSGVAGRAAEAIRVASTRHSLSLQDLAADRIVDIQALLSAGSIGWYGPLGAAPNSPIQDEENVAEPRSDRLAS